MKIWIAAILVFGFALMLRLWNLDMMGRWWDEQWYVEKGYTLVELIKNGNFHDPFWYKSGSDHPPLSSYVYGLASYGDLINFNPKGVSLFPDMPSGAATFFYDLTSTRMVSVVISSLSIVLVFLFGVRYFSYFVGIVAAMILAMLPHFLGYSQLVVLESWIMLLFTACVFSYLLYLETNNKAFIVLTGILTGLNLLVKQSDILIFAFYVAAYFFWRRFYSKNNISIKHLFQIGLIALITCIVLYPAMWLNLKEYWQYTYELWFQNRGRIPELLFGIPMGARSFFYIVAFLVTTPVIIIVLGFLGIKVSWTNHKKWIYVALIIWFLTPFLMSFFHHRQNMVRYIIQFYAPLSLLAAIGFEYIITLVTKSRIIKFSLIAPLFVYQMIILYAISPYYLNYFSETVGGTKNVYEKKLFFLGWFGEGLRGPGMYIAANAKTNDSVGMALNPELPLYRSSELHYETFNSKKKYDYVVVNYFNVIRIGFDESILKKDYKLVYVEKADGAELAHVYKRR